MDSGVLFVDSDDPRAKYALPLFTEKGLCVQSVADLQAAVDAAKMTPRHLIVLAHCSLLNGSFTNLALLMQKSNVTLVFYSTDPSERLRSAPLIPEEIGSLVAKIESILHKAPSPS